jgi:polyhydroxyalkanoate synthesis regulator phasin
MEDFFRKTWQFGLGLMDFTKEKVERLVAEMVRRGEMSQQESSQTVERLLQQAKEQQEVFWAKVRSLISQVITEMGLARKAEKEALAQRVAALEKQMAERRG